MQTGDPLPPEIQQKGVGRDKATDIYGELESGLTFLLTPDWFKRYEEDEIETCKEREDGRNNGKTKGKI